MFSVVETIENGERIVSGVPSCWIVGDSLRWPKTRNINTLRKRRAVPQSDWTSIKCKIVKRNMSLQEVHSMEQKLSLHSDSESEEQVLTLVGQNRTNEVDSTSSSVVKLELPTSIEQTELRSAEVSDSTPSSSKSYQVAMISEQTEPSTEGVEDTMPESVPQENVRDGTSALELGDLLYQVLNDVAIIKQRQDNMITTMSKIDANQKLILEALSKSTMTEKSLEKKENPHEQWIKQNIPLNTSNALMEFNNKLTNECFKDGTISILCTYIPADGKKNGKRVGYKLIDIVVKREVIDMFSWTGSTKSKDTKKLSFNSLRAFKQLFFDVLLKSDHSWTIAKNEEFLQDIVKHSKRRFDEEQAKLTNDTRRIKTSKVMDIGTKSSDEL